MKLSIITINYNDANGLAKTLRSVAAQTNTKTQMECEVEHIIVDGGSTDESVDVIKEYVCRIEEIGLRTKEERLNAVAIETKWVSEKDNGVYNAMNKGIEIALGLREVDSFNRSKRSEDKNKADNIETEHYIQILNAGDILASDHVIEDCRLKIEELDYPEMIYGNMLVDAGEGSFAGSKEVEYSLRQYYTSTMNHDCCWIKRTLFINENEDHSYGLYDEDLKIVSDWKWFLQAIGLGHVKPVYVDIDMTIFEGGGISSMQVDKRKAERRKVLEEVLPPAVLADYDKHAFDMQQMDNLRKHPWAYKLVWTFERVLNRLDNRNFKKPKSK